LALELLGRNALLAGAHHGERHDPKAQLNVRPLKDRADRDRELLAAGATLVDAGPVRLAFKLGRAIHDATMRADGTVRPANALKVVPSLILGHLAQFREIAHCQLHALCA
jgi:hypothetical protein